jgi:hypothetical protein
MYSAIDANNYPANQNNVPIEEEEFKQFLDTIDS